MAAAGAAAGTIVATETTAAATGTNADTAAGTTGATETTENGTETTAADGRGTTIDEGDALAS